VKGAFLHVVADAIGSIGAMIAGAVILFTGWYLVDPAVSILIGCLIVYSSLGLVKESSHILMQGVPPGIEPAEVEKAIVSLDGVCCVYDLHIWSLTNDQHSLSAHVVLVDQTKDEPDLVRRLNRMLSDRFHIDHTTIQVENNHDMRSQHERGLCRPGTECNLLSDNR
jgi:cobalt-zinc-cadmium efflux system protein